MNVAIARLRFTDEKEVISAFLEKRKPEWKEKQNTMAMNSDQLPMLFLCHQIVLKNS